MVKIWVSFRNAALSELKRSILVEFVGVFAVLTTLEHGFILLVEFVSLDCVILSIVSVEKHDEAITDIWFGKVVLVFLKYQIDLFFQTIHVIDVLEYFAEYMSEL